jgi:hypothetical protein
VASRHQVPPLVDGEIPPLPRIDVGDSHPFLDDIPKTGSQVTMNEKVENIVYVCYQMSVNFVLDGDNVLSFRLSTVGTKMLVMRTETILYVFFLTNNII